MNSPLDIGNDPYGDVFIAGYSDNLVHLVCDAVSPLCTAAQAGTMRIAAGCYTALNGPGIHSLSAIYVGDPNNATSNSAAITATVMAIPTTTVVGLSSNSVAVGCTATITALVGSSAGVPHGSVTSITAPRA